MRRIALSFIVTVLLFGVLCCQTLNDAERAIEERDDKPGGIFVGEPKVYDDALLQQLLAAAQARLATLQLIDQTGIAARLGGITGATQDFSSVSFSALGRPSPAVTITSNSPTQTTVLGTTTASTTAATTTTTSASTTSGAAVENGTTQIPQFNASIPTPTPPATTLPTSAGVSASDLLNEEVQLTYEIANLRLLLEGSLSDQILVTRSWQKFAKPRVTIGFPISIAPGRRFRNAVAVVEAEVYMDRGVEALGGEKVGPSITAVLPREKTYNVAAITDRNRSIGAGVVAQVVSVGGSFLSGRRTYYIVKDQDTVATTFKPLTAGPRVGFGWQFRPVLGEPFVQSGLRQTFAQLSFPTTEGTRRFGRVHLRTYWRDYDAGSGKLKGIVPGSLVEFDKDFPIPNFDMRQDLDAFAVESDTQDLGNGTMLVHLDGRFVSGTSIRIGTTLLQPGAGLTVDPLGMRFVAPIADLARGAFVVTRDGRQTPLVESFDGIAGKRPEISDAKVAVLDDVNSRLTITMKPAPIDDLPPLVVVIGGKVLGYADAPIERTIDSSTKIETLTLVLPTAMLAANREVTVKPLLVHPNYFVKKQVIPADVNTERLVLIAKNADDNTLRYLLYGKGLDTMTVIAPEETDLVPVGSGVESDRVRSVELLVDEVKAFTQLIVQRTGERPFGIAIPPLAEPAKTPPKFVERITVGADEAVITGDGLKDVTKIKALGRELTDLVMDGKKLRVRGLVAAGISSTARTVDCTLVTSSDTLGTIPLEIVTSKVESVAK